MLKKLREKQAKIFSKEPKFKKLKAKDAMIKPVFLYADDNSETILKKLKKEQTNACIVINKDKKFIGEISDNNIIDLFLQQTKFEPFVKILNSGYRREFIHKKAKEIAKKHKSLANLDTPINKIIKLIHSRKVEYIPVLDKNKKVKGVITPSSLINLLRKH